MSTVATPGEVLFTYCEACGSRLSCRPDSKYEWQRDWRHVRNSLVECKGNRVLRDAIDALEEKTAFEPDIWARQQLESAWENVMSVSGTFSQRTEQWSKLHSVLGALSAVQSSINLMKKREDER